MYLNYVFIYYSLRNVAGECYCLYATPNDHLARDS